MVADGDGGDGGDGDVCELCQACRVTGHKHHIPNTSRRQIITAVVCNGYVFPSILVNY